MKELRAVSLILKINISSHDRIVKRLTSICKLEGISINANLLEHLLESLGYDARLIINTIQFRLQNYTRSINAALQVLFNLELMDYNLEILFKSFKF